MKAMVKVAEHSFGGLSIILSFAKSWQEKACSSKAEAWQVNNLLMKDFD